MDGKPSTSRIRPRQSTGGFSVFKGKRGRPVRHENEANWAAAKGGYLPPLCRKQFGARLRTPNSGYTYPLDGPLRNRIRPLRRPAANSGIHPPPDGLMPRSFYGIIAADGYYTLILSTGLRPCAYYTIRTRCSWYNSRRRLLYIDFEHGPTAMCILYHSH